MREIKFRIWNNGMSPAGSIQEWLIDYPKTLPALLDDQEYANSLTFLQYTGLKDKNGVEIYEGDIVRHLKYGGNFPIVYSSENTGYDLKAKKSGMHLCSSCCPNLKVIGNIYENPELLNVRDE